MEAFNQADQINPFIYGPGLVKWGIVMLSGTLSGFRLDLRLPLKIF